MKNLFNAICLGIWIVILVMDITYASAGLPIRPLSAICPVIVCITFYIERLAKGDK